MSIKRADLDAGRVDFSEVAGGGEPNASPADRA
jgi:hypothetical protein